MTAEPENKPVPSKDAVSRLWLQQLSHALSWSERHPAKLAAAAIVLPSLSLTYYLQAERIPLSILSSDVISGLPSLLVIISAITVALFALALTPLMVMFEGAVTEGDGSIRVSALSTKQRVRNTKRWLIALILPGAILAAALVLSARYPGHDKWALPLSIALGAAAFVAASFLLGRKEKKRHWFERAWYAAASGYVQMLLALLVIQRMVTWFPDIESFWLMFILLFVSMVAVGAAQLCAVLLIENISKDGMIAARAFYASLAIIVAICVVPVTGGWLAGHVVSSSGSGGMKCFRLAITGDKSDFSKVIDWSDRGQKITKPLRMRAATSSMYYVRLKDEVGEISTIPTDRVAGFLECPAVNKAAAKAATPDRS